MAFSFGDFTQPVREIEGLPEIGEPVFLLQVMFVNDLPP